MQNITRFSEAQKVLAKFVTPMSDRPYTLDTMKRLMDFLGNPQNQLKVIHVAGTSGKTSTSYYLAALLHSTGRSVGLSVSPHIDSPAERAQINMKQLNESDYCKELSIFLGLVEGSGISPSYFEVLVAFMYWLFHKRGVDYAVVEVGLGGLLDGTNVINREDKICVITDIGLDHTNILGTTLPEIAAQKAGIIFPKNNVYMHSQPQEVMTVFEETCQRHNAMLHVVDSSLPIDDSSLIKFQRRNLSLAYSVISELFPDQKKELISSLQTVISTYIPARMEEIKWHGKTIILDGSHNEQKIGALVEAIQEKFNGKPLRIVASFGKNKSTSLRQSLRLLRRLSESIILTQFDHEQDEIRVPIDPVVIADSARSEGFKEVEVQLNPDEAILEATKHPEETILVTGSFYLIGQVRPFIFKD